MKTKYALTLILCTVVAIYGCNKDDNDDTPPTGNSGSSGPVSFQELFAQNVAAATQHFPLSATGGGQLIGAQGTRLQFEPNAFLHADGSPVTGQVVVSLVEVLTIADMIHLNKQTVGNDNGILKMLRSGGAVRVTATQNGSTLRLAEGGLVVRIPTTVGDPAMQLFSGNETADGNMIWDVIDSATVTVEPVYVDLSYTFTADSLGWINCDYFIQFPSTTILTATIPAAQSTDSTRLWIAFPTENAVMEMNHSNGQTYATWQIVPVGMPAVIVGLRRTVDGDYSSITPVTITNDMDVPMTFSLTTMEEFQDALNAL